VEKKEPTSKKLKIRGHYTNWFEPSLWDPIFAAVRKHRKYQQCMQVLEDDVQETGRELWYLRSRSNMYEWFTSTGELKDVYKKYVDEGSSNFQGGNQHCLILSNHQELKETIIEMLHAHKKA
jgi:hypothetical protein